MEHGQLITRSRNVACAPLLSDFGAAVWRLFRALCLVLALGFVHSGQALAQSVQGGLTYWNANGCSGCHTVPPSGVPGQNNRNGSNNPAAFLTAIGVGGVMAGQYPGATATDAMNIALYLGQVEAPGFTTASPVVNIRVRSGYGTLVTKDVYSLLRKGLVGVTYFGAAGDGTAGTSNGLLRTAPANTASSSATSSAVIVGAGGTMNYNIRYQPSSASQFAGDDSFSFTVQNGAGSAGGTVNVQVYGITNPPSTIQALKGNTYTGGTLYTAICNSCVGGSFSATGLPTGLSIDPTSGQINGTPANSNTIGNYSVVVRATSSGATDSGDGVVSKSFTLQLGGINSGTPGPFGQGMTITAYNVTTTAGGAGANAPYSLTPLPTGLAFNTGTGQLTGSPASSGSFPVTITATTPGGVTSENVTIVVNAASVPTAISSNLPLSTVSVAGAVGTPIDGAGYSISATSGTPVTYSSTELVAIGLTVNPTNGAITGTPNTSGDIPVVLRASNIGGAGTPLNRTIRISPSTAPVVNSATPPNGNVGTDYATTAFFVTATNPLITGFAVASGSALPTGLTLNTSTGQITGAPGASGIFRTRFTASNSVGTSAPVEFTFNIISNAKPGITGPTFASFPAGVAIAPIQITATNPVITAYMAVGLPTGLTLDTATGVISGAPVTPGTYTVGISADNDAPGAPFGAVSNVQFNVGVPAPSACAMSVPLNTATTLDLASCLFAGFVPTGVSLVATPAHGTAVVSGTKVTYTPVFNFFGTDTFTFVGSGVGGNSPQGTVTVTVTGRPDPMQDATVTGLLTAQVESAQRFSRAQISNFQRRMESLHRPAGDAGGAGTRLQGRIDTPASTGFGSAALAARDIGITPQTPGGITALAANQTPTVARESDVLAALAAGAGVQSMPLAESVISLVKNRSVNLSGVASGLGLNGKPTMGADGGTSYWIEGVATFGTRDARGGFSSSEFSSDGITVGVDKRYSDQLALGMGLGYGRDKTLIGADGSVNRAKGYSLALYGSYQPTPTTFVDGLIGIGSLDFDTTRYVAPISDFAYGKRSGNQVFGSLTGGYEFRNGNLLVSPYGRIDFSTDRLHDSIETGAGAYALRYMRQTSTSIQGAVGMRAESIHAADFGYVVPRARVEYRHELKRSGDAYVQYADQLGGPLYRLTSAGGPRDSVLLGLGSDFILRDGLTLSLEYQLSHSFANASTHALRLRLSKDFDVRGLPRMLAPGAETESSGPINVQVEAGAVYDDNVTRAKAGPDRVGDHLYSVNVGKVIRQPLSANSQLLWIGNIGGEKFRRYNGLSRASITGEVEYQYRASSEFDEPTFGAFARLSGDAFESELRDGYRLTAGVSVRQSLTDRINVFAALSHNMRKASSQVFSTSDNSIRGNIDYALSDKDILYMGAEFRRGDIVSTGRASLEAVTVADVFAQDDAYPGGQMFSYRFRGNTSLLTIGYNMGLGPRDSIDFSWRHIRSTPGLRPSFVTSPHSYTANQLSLVYLMRF